MPRCILRSSAPSRSASVYLAQSTHETWTSSSSVIASGCFKTDKTQLSLVSFYLVYTVTSLSSQAAMTSSWLLLLLLVVFSQSVNSQSTTDDEETCAGGGLLSKLQTDVERMLDNQQRLLHLLQQQQTVSDCQGVGKSYQIYVFLSGCFFAIG